MRAGGRLKYIGPIPVLLLRGTPEEMGRQQGLLLAEAKPLLRALLKDYLHTPRLGTAWPAMALLCKAALRRAPESYRRELEAGIQAAALTGEERDALVAVNVLAEMPHLGGCSSLVVEPSRSKTGQMLFGRNLDSPCRNRRGDVIVLAWWRSTAPRKNMPSPRSASRASAASFRE